MELVLFFKVETLKGEFLAATGESSKIFPLQNFVLYSIYICPHTYRYVHAYTQHTHA